MMIMMPAVQEEDWQPSQDAIEAMSKYNEELTRAGVLLALDGLQAPSKGARVSFRDGESTVTDGPFTESTEQIGGYWLIQAKSRDEAIEWATRCPGFDGDVIEVRPVYELSDYEADTGAA
jgi:hypothetical protein